MEKEGRKLEESKRGRKKIWRELREGEDVEGIERRRKENWEELGDGGRNC